MDSFFSSKARAATSAAKAKENGAHGDLLASQPWVEKYRPKTLSDVAAQDHTITVLQRNLQSTNLPHMLFYGPPGTGKTSTILALSKSLFGPTLFRTRVLELNASDERGISVVREKIKDFSRTHLSNPPANDLAYRSRYPCPPFKIIILDEADSMTQDAQSALRRTMEKYSRITRFCLVCNFVTRIIDPLASRCSKFRFKALDGLAAEARLTAIAKMENLEMDDGVLQALLWCSDGDLRRAITFLQSAASMENPVPAIRKDESGQNPTDPSSTPRRITRRSVEEVSGAVPKQNIDHLVATIRPQTGPPTYQTISNAVTNIVADGYSALQVISQIYEVILWDESILDEHKNRILQVFSEFDKRIVDGADEHLSILDFMLQVSGIANKT